MVAEPPTTAEARGAFAAGVVADRAGRWPAETRGWLIFGTLRSILGFALPWFRRIGLSIGLSVMLPAHGLKIVAALAGRCCISRANASRLGWRR